MLICYMWGVSWPSCGACKGICTPVLVSFGLCWRTLGGGTLAVAGWCTTAAFFHEGVDFRWLRFCGQVCISWPVFPHAPHFLCFFAGGGPSACAWQAPLASASIRGALMVMSTFFREPRFWQFNCSILLPRNPPSEVCAILWPPLCCPAHFPHLLYNIIVIYLHWYMSRYCSGWVIMELVVAMWLKISYEILGPNFG